MPSTNYETAYWFSDYASAILARTYLQNNKIKYELFSDEWSGDWVIVADLSR